ncbi:SDR family NAD(P)-dependent oxidoreductase [Streptomyces sp. NPDC089799]|uniref:SDR family NAD(P)-dependent oxidoreductase n=1 Tax=Streptomyces sp. NPDC089799 TaxID=3155066 RepID=UPI0034276C37
MGNPHRTGAGRPLALVTGASSGIGLALAGELADHGHDLVLAAEDDTLHEAADRIRRHSAPSPARTHSRAHPRSHLHAPSRPPSPGHPHVLAVQADLATQAGVEAVYDAVYETVLVRDAPVAVAVLNAGIGHAGAFLESEPADHARVIDLNLSSTVYLARLLLPGMVERGEGRMLITSSAVADLPGPFHAVHNASQAFLKSFALGLGRELEGTGVTVTTLLPGLTDSRFFVRAGLLDTRLGRSRKTDPAVVARQARAALLADRPRAVAGPRGARAKAMAVGLLPERVRVGIHRWWAEPGGGQRGL